MIINFGSINIDHVYRLTALPRAANHPGRHAGAWGMLYVAEGHGCARTG